MITIILFIFFLLFGGCRGVLGLGLLYTDSPPPTPMILPTVAIVEATPTFTFTPNHSKGEPSVTPTPTSTFTPTPFATPSADTAPCTIVVRQPPINSPTQIPNSLSTPYVGVPLDIHLAYCMNLGTVVVGDTWQLLVHAIDMELPVYYLTITNDDSEELSIRYDPNSPADFEFSSDLSALSIMSVTTHRQSQTLFTFMATEVDVVEISLFATGLVQYDYSNPAISTSTPSETFFLAINE